MRDALSPILRRWRRQKVITFAELRAGLNASIRTVRRRLKEWKALASFNHNSRYYTLPELPQFDDHGLWFFREIGFSRHGHLPQTIVALVRQAPAGLSAAELGQRLHMDPRSFLWQFHQYPGLQREKYQGHYVYFAAESEWAARQKASRSAPLAPTPLPSASEAIAILVQAIQHPQCTAQQLCDRLHPDHPQLTAPMILGLFAHHGLTLKKTRPTPGSNA
jgi:hypothetical protein